jgi:hypothetical protein
MSTSADREQNDKIHAFSKWTIPTKCVLLGEPLSGIIKMRFKIFTDQHNAPEEQSPILEFMFKIYGVHFFDIIVNLTLELNDHDPLHFLSVHLLESIRVEVNRIENKAPPTANYRYSHRELQPSSQVRLAYKHQLV